MTQTGRPILRRLTAEEVAAYGPAAWDASGPYYGWTEPLPSASILVEDVLPDGRVLAAWRLAPGMLVQLSYSPEVDVPPGTERRVDGRPFETYREGGWR